jgi:hypothetical protein
MAQHDYVIANGTGAAVRSDLNNGLAAIVSNNSGATEPGTMYAYQWWADTTTGLLKLRNSANSAWISLRELDGTLTIEDGTAAAPGLAFTSDLNTGLFRVGADQIAISTGGTSRLAVSTTAVSSTLAVGVGTASPAQLLHVSGSGTQAIRLENTLGTGNVNLELKLTNGTFTTGLNSTSIYYDDTAGRVYAWYQNSAERMRLDTSGRLLVGTSSTLLGLTSSTLHVNGAQAAVFVGNSGSAGNQVLYVQHTNTSGDNLFIEFGTEASLTTRGSIDYNRAAGLVRYNATSDRRLKSAIQPATSAVDLLSSIQVRSYKWTETDYTVNYGFIAQELHQVLPDAVKVGDDGKKVQDVWAVDNSKVVPLLTKALQEAVAKIESLEARLTAAGID